MSATKIAALIILAVVAGNWTTNRPIQQAKTYCALALPPSQVVRTPQLEAVYCQRMLNGQCHAGVGWIIVSEPVPCE